MNIYYSILLILLILSLLEIKDKKVSVLVFPLFVLVFWFMGSFRWNTGTDWDSYCDFFSSNASWNDFWLDGYPFEKGYVLLNYTIKQFSSSYSVYLSICSLINIVCFLIVCKKYFRERPVFALMLYFMIFQGGIFVTRQLLAMSLCFLSIIYIEQRKIKSFVMIVLLACMLHITAIAFFFSYYAYYQKISVKKFVVYLSLTIVLSFFISAFFSFILNNMSQGRIATKILIYNSDERVFGFVSLMMGIAKRILVLPIFFYIREKYNHSQIYSGLLNIYLFGTLVYFLFAVANLGDFVRFSSAFQLMEIPLLYLSYLSCRRPLTMLFIIVLGVLKLYSFTSVYYDLYVPFYTIFDTQILR